MLDMQIWRLGQMYETERVVLRHFNLFFTSLLIQETLSSEIDRICEVLFQGVPSRRIAMIKEGSDCLLYLGIVSSWIMRIEHRAGYRQCGSHSMRNSHEHLDSRADSFPR